MKRALSLTLLALGLAVMGFGLGGIVAGRLLTSPADGMAGAATAAVGAFAGALVGALAGILLALRLTGPVLSAVAVAAFVIGSGGLGLLVWRGANQRSERVQGEVPSAEAVGPGGLPLPPPLPGATTLDSLQGLVTVPPESLTRFQSAEYGYEETGVKVFGQSGNWFLVRRPDSSRAWLHTRVTGRYFPLSELVVNRLNWLTEAWDTRLRDTPDPAAPATEAPVPRAGGQEIPAKVIEARVSVGTLWLLVEVLETSPCEGGVAPPVIARGWIPAWARDGRPTAWFYSRGC